MSDETKAPDRARVEDAKPYARLGEPERRARWRARLGIKEEPSPWELLWEKLAAAEKDAARFAMIRDGVVSLDSNEQWATWLPHHTAHQDVVTACDFAIAKATP